MLIKNSLNEIPLKEFKANEMNLYFLVLQGLISNVAEGSTQKLFPYDDLAQELIPSRMVHEIKVDIENVAYKSKRLINFGKELLPSPLFKKFDADSESQILEVEINPALIDLFTIDKEWTNFNLKDFFAIRSKYGKTLYRLLKQYQVIGKRSFELTDYRRLMGIPDNYRMAKVRQFMIDSTVTELLPYIGNLNYSIERHGWKLEKVTFTFDSRKKQLLQQNDDEK